MVSRLDRSGNPQVCASLLWLALLLAGNCTTADSTSFTPSDTPASSTLEGLIKVIPGEVQFEEVYRESWLLPATGILPVMKFRVVSVDGAVVPFPRSLQITTHPLFDYIVSPGRSWSEVGKDWASVPFTLIHRLVNCTHNGLLQFSYTDTGISDATLQVRQETCHFYKFNATAEPSVTYALDPVPNRDQIRADYEREISNRLPVKPLSEFTSTYEVDADQFLQGLPTDDDLTVAGIYYEGVHYRSDCRTRSDPYPYCDHMLHTSFSTSKSVYPPIVLMHLAQNHDTEVFSALLKDYVAETEDSPGDWEDVTFDHVVDMASGNFNNDSPLLDLGPGNFYGPTDSATKLADALSWDNGAEAGTTFVYQTADTYILVAGLDRYLEFNDTGFSDSFEYVVEKVYRPLGISPEVLFSRRANDDAQVNTGRALGGFGLWWDTDSIVKLSKFMLIDNGAIDGEQLLHPGFLAATVQRDSQDRGIDTRVAGQRYNNGMWAIPAHIYVPAIGDCEAWVPSMSGLSGIRIFLMPNGLIFYYFNDAFQFPSIAAIDAANQVSPLCPDE